jgi:hypothetical protein
MGSYFGHIYPALFCLFFVLWHLFVLRRNSTRGVASSENSKVVTGLFLLALTLIAIGIEGVGGILYGKTFFFEFSHQASYLGFGLAGLAAIAEFKRWIPHNSWRLSLAIGFLLEGLVMLGHSEHFPTDEIEFL